jgi:hypothetical protein
MDNPLNDYEQLRPQKPQNGRPRNGFIQKRGGHFDRFVTSHRPKTATLGVAGSLTDIMEMHLHARRVSRVQNAHVWRGTAPPFAIPSHVPPKALRLLDPEWQGATVETMADGRWPMGSRSWRWVQ